MNSEALTCDQRRETRTRPSPSPRPSPSGRGGLTRPSVEISGPLLGSGANKLDTLSLGERAGVRGNATSGLSIRFVLSKWCPRFPVRFLLLAALSAPSALAADPHDPAAEQASFKVAEGFDVSLFASESEGVVKPIQIRFDARGRLWVVGSAVYPQIKPGAFPNDKVLILDDRNRDGRIEADEVMVFADGLMIPTGLEVTGDANGCYLGEGPNLWLLRDTNGDGRADQKEIILRGFGTGDNHQNINSFRWGPGGEIWFCQGLHNLSRVETPWGVQALDQAGIWRFWPRRLKLEGFYGSAAEPQNPWGFVFTDWGEPLELAGNNSSIIYPVPGLTPRHRPDQPTLIWREGRGRKMSGGEFVQTAHFPDAWQGRLLVAGYINNAVWAMNMADDGAGFALTDAEPLITTTNKSFRPVDARFGPDGALYLADWYNPIIGHYQASFRHPERDHERGRIWRVTAKGRAPTQLPKIADAPIAELLGQLNSTDRWTRDFAKLVLRDRPQGEVVPAVRAWAGDSRRTELELKEALGILQSHEVVEPALLERLTRATDPGARAYAASVIGHWADRLDDPLALLAPLANDAHPRVRLQTIVAASWVTKVEAIEVVLEAATNGTDPFIDYALRQAVFSLKPLWLPALQAGQLAATADATRLGLLVRYDGSADTLAAVRELLARPQTPASSRASLLMMLNEPAALERLLPAVVRSARLRLPAPPASAARLLKPLLADGNSQIQGEALRVAGIWKLAELKPELIARATNSPAAMDGLVALDPAAAADLFVERLQTADAVAGVDSLIEPFLNRKDALEPLVAALQTTPPSRTNARAVTDFLNQRGFQHTALLNALATAAGARPTQRWQWSDAFARELAGAVREAGNAARGREIFHRAELACVACHRVGAEGGLIGPALDTLGTAQPVDFIVGAILEPTKEIKEGYEAYEIETKSGDLLTGYRIRSDREQVVLRESAATETITLRREQVQTERPVGTLMPPGLVDSLTREELRDLVAYLAGLGRPVE
jgi:putative heme-binding domain-containing protein